MAEINTPNSERPASSSTVKNHGRRRLIQALSVGGVAAGAAALPDRWIAPVIDAVTLPAHGQTTEQVFFGEGALNLVDSISPQSGSHLRFALKERSEGGLLGAFVPLAHAGSPGDASSSSFSFTMGFLSADNTLTLRFDLIFDENVSTCDPAIVVPVCHRGKVNENNYRVLPLINCAELDNYDLEVRIASRDDDMVILDIRLNGGPTDKLALLPGGAEPPCPNCNSFDDDLQECGGGVIIIE